MATELTCWDPRCGRVNRIQRDPDPSATGEYWLTSCQYCGNGDTVLEIVNRRHVITCKSEILKTPNGIILAARRRDRKAEPAAGASVFDGVVKVAARGSRLVESEARILERLQPGRTPRKIDYGIASGRPYLLMNRVGARTLEYRPEEPGTGHVRPAEPPLPDHPILRLDLLLSLADELIRVHACGVWHRDIKPSNVCVQEVQPFATVIGGGGGEAPRGVGRFRAVPIDFGIAIDHEAGARQHRIDAGHHCTCPFAPMEQYATGSKEFADRRPWNESLAEGPATDVYAMTAVVLDFLLGTRPYASRLQRAHLDPDGKPSPQDDRKYYESLASVASPAALTAELGAQVTAKVAALQLGEAAHAALVALLLRGLFPVPSGRFPTMQAFRDALFGVLCLAVADERSSPLTSGAAAVGRLAILEEWVRRGSLPTATLFAVCAAIAGGGADARRTDLVRAFGEVSDPSEGACQGLRDAVARAFARPVARSRS